MKCESIRETYAQRDDNIEQDFIEVGYEAVDRSLPVQDND